MLAAGAGSCLEWLLALTLAAGAESALHAAGMGMVHRWFLLCTVMCKAWKHSLWLLSLAGCGREMGRCRSVLARAF